MSDDIGDGRPAGGLRRAVTNGALHLAIRQAASVALKFIGLMLITRVLGPEKYGAFVAANQVYGWLMLVAVGGVALHLVRADVWSEDEAASAYGLLAIVAAAMAIGLLALALVFDRLVNVEGAGLVLATLALAVPFQMLTTPATALLERRLRFDTLARIEIGSQVAYYAVATALILSGVGPVGLAVAYLTQTVAVCVFSHRGAQLRPRFAFRLAAGRDLAGAATSFTLATLIWNARALVLPFIVGPVLGAGALGVLGMAIGFCDLLTVLKAVAWRLSVAALRHVKADLARLRAAMQEGAELQMLALGGVLLGFGWVAPLIVPWLFGARWMAALDVYPFIALGYFTNAAFNMQSSALSLLDRQRDVLAFNAAHLALFAGAAALLAPRFGIYGYGMAEIAAFPAYLALERATRRAVGAMPMRRVALWWAGVAIGLFQSWLGAFWPLGVIAPFAALATPDSRRRLVELARRFRGAGGAPARDAVASRGSDPVTPAHRRFLFLRTERPEIDFRLALAKELAGLGHDVTYVFFRRRPTLIALDDTDRRTAMSLPAFLIYVLREHARRPGLVVWNSTNLNFPGLSLLLRALIGGVWCFDLHDDLVYGATGWRRRIREAKLRLLAACSDMTVAVSPLLAERAPGARTIANASYLPACARDGVRDGPVLILASIDDRLDVDFMRDLAALDRSIEYVVRGHVTPQADAWRERFVGLLRAAPNIRHEGPYLNAELQTILSRFDLTLAPYVVNAPQTRYIDPLRFHHCLRMGMELLTTSIPAAAQHGARVHVLADPRDALHAIRGLRTGLVARRNLDGRDAADWRDRARELLSLLDARSATQGG